MKSIVLCGILPAVLITSSCARPLAKKSAVTVSVADVSAVAGEKISVPVTSDNGSADILGIDLQLAYNPGTFSSWMRDWEH
jgi:hypothetical protein